MPFLPPILYSFHFNIWDMKIGQELHKKVHFFEMNEQ